MTGLVHLPRRLGPLVLFGALAGLVVLAEYYLVHWVGFGARPGLGVGVACDLLVVLPGLFYWLVVRRYQLPPRTVAVAVGAGLGLARWLLGAGLPLLAWAGWAVQGAEVLALGYTLLRLRRVVHAYWAARQQSPHVLENLLVAGRAGLGRLGPLVAMEAAVLRYAVLGAWTKPEVGVGEVAFSTSRQSGFGALLVALGALVMVEAGAVHLVLARWHPVAAWVLTGASGYSLLWLLAHGQAVRCRPVLVAGPALVLRVGFCWRATIPLAAITGARLITKELPSETNILNTARLLLTPPNVLLRLAAPQVVQGPFGLRRTTRYLALYVDEPAVLLARLAAGVA